MKVFFVVDIKCGKVVAGKSGERESYPPITSASIAVSSDDAVEVVEEIKPRFLYAADLDRIMGTGNNLDILIELSKRVEEFIADCGFRSPAELEDLPFKPVVGTETFDITLLDRKCYVSIDFKKKFLDASGKFGSWKEAVEFLNSFKLDGIIVLPIHAVGTMRADFSILEQALEISENPVLLGGGISGIEDLERLKEMGCKGVLIATAIHRGRIPVSIVRRGEF
mgnify:CR=1 FL=1